MSKFPVPDTSLARHIANVGETGSGKTYDTKTIVEHVAKEGYRVCILDTIKSDWWGITSSANGKKPGLPFKILGGPRGHVPLHSGAGKAIGQLVGEGKLPLSIIDMADFEPGGPQRFFEQFAQALWKHTRGVVYLVIEEVHEIAPKERAGFGAENMAIHWAKKLATGSRTKGIRLIIASQRTQAVHNALLGSCGTLIAHSLSLPADQKPIIDWLDANVRDKTLRGTIKEDLAFLPTGTAWVCCAKDNFFKKIAFPNIATFDNTATPDKDADDFDVTTAPVDPEELKAIIGTAVKEAEANDPKVLKAELAKANVELAKLRRTPAQTSQPVEKINTAQIERAITAAKEDGRQMGWADGWRACWSRAWSDGATAMRNVIRDVSAPDPIIPPVPPRAPKPANVPQGTLSDGRAPVCKPAGNYAKPMQAARPARTTAFDGDLTTPQRRIMASLAFWRSIGHETPTREQVAAVAGYRPGSGNFNNLIGSLSSAGHTSVPSPGCLTLVSDYPGLNPDEAKSKLWSIFENPQRRLVEAALAAPNDLARDELATNANYAPSSGNFNNICGSLTSMDVLQRTGQGRVGISDWARTVLA